MNARDPYDETQLAKDSPLRSEEAVTEDQVERMGRYRVQEILGKGGFGLVYLAEDEQLKRLVAIKVPYAELVSDATSAEEYLIEARTVANLDHPNIVPVFDVGSTDDCVFYIVSKYIDGINLGQKIQEGRPSYDESAELVATVAEALDYAHEQGLVHRDVKPGNILIDKSGQAFVVDFGLALSEEGISSEPSYAGTPAFMSPEQARGEGHRVDNRSDIFSLGSVFYELLAGSRPFRGENQRELFERVRNHEPRPLRQYDKYLPRELERICNKAMAKRASERYASSIEMAEDLRLYLREQSRVETKGSPGESDRGVDAEDTRNREANLNQQLDVVDANALMTFSGDVTRSEKQPIKIIPKGLRSFDAHDAGFFTELLPGARDRDGVPDILRFWKTRIEEMDSDHTFPVGLIYGPSGCGKSSMVKAGLLPLLSEDVLSIYVESTPLETETRLLQGIRKQCPEVAGNPSLKDTIAALRRQQGLPAGKKVLIVLDQFEQWLHAKKTDTDTELVQALRQCDGGHVQCIVMLRDDFWMAATRFMRDLDMSLLEGQNSLAVDLFPVRHAEKVLQAFGRAFGVIDSKEGWLDKEQEQFIKQCVAGLAEEDKVICVRLALFVEMMKGKPWTPASLVRVGGTSGVGVAFLEETFSAPTAPPKHRFHEKAARAVLKNLLPDSGTDIKGAMRSYSEIREASGYRNRGRDFEDLIGILDRELRLITPTDPEGLTANDDSTLKTEPGVKYFQLTHDYLVPSLREWLTRKQQETRKGRAELKLVEHAALWNSKPKNQFLPSLSETTGIYTLTDRQQWSASERRMMWRSIRLHGVRFATILTLISITILIGLGVRRAVKTEQKLARERNVLEQREIQANGFVTALLGAQLTQVPGLAEDVVPLWSQVKPRLLDRLQSGNDAEDSEERLKISLLLLRDDPGQLEYIKSRILVAQPNHLDVLRRMVVDYKDRLAGDLWQVVTDGNGEQSAQLLSAASMLAFYESENPQWGAVAKPVVESLVKENSLRVATWIELLRPVRLALLQDLSNVFRNVEERFTPEQQALATEILEQFASDQPQFLAELALEATPEQFLALFDELKGKRTEVLPLLADELDRSLGFEWQKVSPNPEWVKLDGSVASQFAAASGFISDRFAYCQTMPFKQFLAVTDLIKPAGYRPFRVRPYQKNELVQVAAIWTRDSHDWEMFHGMAAEQIMQIDRQQRSKGMSAIDVAGYLENQQGEAKEHFVGIWRKHWNGQVGARVWVGLSETGMDLAMKALIKQGFLGQQSLQSYLDTDGQVKYCGVRNRVDALNHRRWLGMDPVEISEKEYLGKACWDIDLRPAQEIRTSREVYQAKLTEANKVLKLNPHDMEQRLHRGIAHFGLGKMDIAIEELSAVLEAEPRNANGYLWRAHAYARNGETERAREDVAEHNKVGTSERHKAYLEAIVAAYSGEAEKGMERLEQLLNRKGKDGKFLYSAACAFSVASAIVSNKGKVYADRAVGLLHQAVDRGYSDFSHLQTDLDLRPLHAHGGYQELLSRRASKHRYSALWRSSKEVESKVFHDLPPEEHLLRCQMLIEQGYRPFAISAVASAEEIVSASVWHRPAIREVKKEDLAQRQANAAIGLLRMGQADRVWPLLKHSPDPRLRSWIIHQLGATGSEPAIIRERLQVESDVSTRRALIWCLGKSDLDAFSDPDGVSADLLRWYRDDPDSGIHAACEWALRGWGLESQIASIDQELSHGKIDNARNWYLTTEGHAMSLLGGPAEFIMGDSAVGKHRRRIDRRFALATKEITVAQFQRFVRESAGMNDMTEKRWSPNERCPQTSLSWYQAAAYCRWLSEQEGIPEDQMCYPPIPEIKEGMVLPKDHLSRTGYRLPTEAEWEYGCHAGAETERYYGAGDQLLVDYGWALSISDHRTWPVGLLIPNDFGLFDMYGNVREWCQERQVDYGDVPRGMLKDDEEDLVPVRGRINRILRGGSFCYQTSDVRSTNRQPYHLPEDRFNDFGFRPARTIAKLPLP